MSTLREAAQQALIALENCIPVVEAADALRKISISNLRAALAQPDDKAQPVAWTPDQRETLRKAIMAEIDRRVSSVRRNHHDWREWPGTWVFADCAVSVFAEKFAPQPPAEQSVEV